MKIVIFLLIIFMTGAQFADGGKDSLKEKKSVIYIADTSGNKVKNESAVTQEKPSSVDKKENSGIETASIWVIIPVIIGVAMFIFGIYQYRKRKSIEKEKTTAGLEAKKEFEQKEKDEVVETNESRYKAALMKELGDIKILGSPTIDTIPVKLMDTFVSLRLSTFYRTDKRIDYGRGVEKLPEARDFTPDEIIELAFKEGNLLLIIGDPGSGKTTLVKYFSVTNIEEKRWADMTFYLPLREIDWKKEEIDFLPEILAKSVNKCCVKIKADDFYNWLHSETSLVLLDGLDEISDIDDRKKACEWIDHTTAGLGKARFVVTSRWTGYRKADGIELAADHLRADVKDFNDDQQADFLKKWLKAAYLRDLPLDGEADETWKRVQTEKADSRAIEMLDFLMKEDNKSVKELAVVPMLLQIMAIIWKERDFIPKNRNEMFNSSLDYLLELKDRQKHIDPLLGAADARRALSPASLWMQRDLKSDEADKDKMHEKLQEVINTFDKRPEAKEFCENLIDRAGILASYSDEEYIFRHKSFREFLAGMELAKGAHNNQYIQLLVDHFGESWWDEPIRFFISQADADMFDEFMGKFFLSEKSKDLNQNELNYLMLLVREAPEKPLTSVEKALLNEKTTIARKRYILEILKTINRPDAFEIVNKFIKNEPQKELSGYAAEILFEAGFIAEGEEKENIAVVEGKGKDRSIIKTNLSSFRNAFEDNAEYILIPGGTFNYSVTGEDETFPGIYFAKYPVTNKRFALFTGYLSGKNRGYYDLLPPEKFKDDIIRFSKEEPVFYEHVKSINNFAKEFKSWQDEKRFLNDDQPVVNVNWYTARVYCYWLSFLELAEKGITNPGMKIVNNLFRLPDEKEWEWAAGGGSRTYPWGDDEADLEKRANFNKNVGCTTPVGRYPEGATPEGLHDMAGNVWEWMKNEHEKYKGSRSLRGGSWYTDRELLFCSARVIGSPSCRGSFFGFRVVRPVI